MTFEVALRLRINYSLESYKCLKRIKLMTLVLGNYLFLNIFMIIYKLWRWWNIQYSLRTTSKFIFVPKHHFIDLISNCFY